MEIFITDKLAGNVSAEALCVLKKAEDDSLMFTVQRLRGDGKEQTAIDVCGEDAAEQAARALAAYCADKQVHVLALDVPSLAGIFCAFSYLCSCVCDALVEQRLVERIFFAGIPVNPDLTARLEKHLARPIIVTENHVFGDLGNELKEKFERFAAANSGQPFNQYLVQLMYQKGCVDSPSVYKAAGISKYTFSKIMNYKRNHKPSKETVAALTIGLKLNIKEAEELYHAAGYHLGTGDFVDKVIRFFISEKLYDIDEVNICLSQYGHPPLGEKLRDTKITMDMDK